MAGPKEIDELTGIDTTGHEWDGIKELNNPMPRWWLWTFYATVLWSVGYWVLMPGWPLISDFTRGILDYSSRGSVAQRIDDAREAQRTFIERIEAASLEEVRGDPELLDFALAGGRSAFAVNCSQCHGLGAAGSPGYANLNDDAWLWGGQLDEIAQTIRYGIRSDHDDTRLGDMPGFLRDEILDRDQVADVTEYVVSLSGGEADAAAVERGAEVFVEQCVACHAEGGVGMHELGAPNLTDSIWLYGGGHETIVQSISNGRAGVMPAWVDRLDEATVKQMAVYVHSLGGGE